MERELIRLYDAFTHGAIDRRTFLSRAGQLLGGVAAASLWLDRLRNDYTQAQLVDPEDEQLVVDRVQFAGSNGAISGYLARPRQEGRFPAVIVIHENRGLNRHIEDVTRRLGLAGFLALAPDALSPAGTPADEDKAREAISALDPEQAAATYLGAVNFARQHAQSTGAVGCVGFCWGGAMANQLAVRSTELRAAVAFYGRQPASEDVPRIQAALLLHYAGLDERINVGIDAYRAALEASKVRFQLYVYDGVEHAFHNDTSPQRYNAEAAKLAWERTVAFLQAELGEAKNPEGEGQ